MGDAWSPKPPPPPLPPRPQRTFVNALAIWAVLVALFALLAGQLGVEPAPVSSLWILGAVAVTATALLLLGRWMVGASHRFNAKLTPGFEALADGDHREAVAVFAALARDHATHPTRCAVAAYNHAYALTRAGDTESAVGILRAIEANPKLAGIGLRRQAAGLLGRCYALGGDVATARRWLAATRAHPSLGNAVSDRAVADILEGLVLCREGELAKAVRHFDQAWPRIELSVSLPQLREAWLLRAYAIAASASPREVGAAEPYLRMLRGTPARELALLTERWPALATFVATSGLS